MRDLDDMTYVYKFRTQRLDVIAIAVEIGPPPRYQTRVLDPKHIDWAAAIVLHSNRFYSTTTSWRPVPPNEQTSARPCMGRRRGAEAGAVR